MVEPPNSRLTPTDAASPTGFDRVAWCYDVLASLVFGPAQRRTQRAALAGLPPAAAPHVLILGGGTGWVLIEVLRRRPQATVLYLEASPKMLARAHARLAHACPQAAHQVEFRHGTQAALKPDERFDAIITFFVLDCVAAFELDAALAALRRALRAGAPWLLADFRFARHGWRQWLLAAMYWFFQLTTGLRASSMPDLRAALGSLGLQPRYTATFFANSMEAVIFSESETNVALDI